MSNMKLNYEIADSTKIFKECEIDTDKYRKDNIPE